MAVDAAMAEFSRFMTNRSRHKLPAWQNALIEAGANIDERMQSDPEFADAVLDVTIAALRSHGEAKLHWYAQLIANYDQIVASGDYEDFSDLLRLVDDVSTRELLVLLKMRELENSSDRPSDTDDSTWAFQFWPQLEDFAVASGIARESLVGFFDRLQRTGLFREFLLSGGNRTHGYGYTMPNLTTLVDAIARHDRETA